MKRRRFLALGGVGVGAAGGYLGLRWYRAPSVPTGMTVETKHFERDVLTDRAARDPDFLEWQAEYHEVITEREAATERVIDDESVTAFLAETTFEASYVIVVQNGMQSEMELVLDAIARRPTGLHLDISIDAPRGGPDDLRVHSLLVRVTDEGEEPPADVSVDIEGYV
jgi:hypothetical protein